MSSNGRSLNDLIGEAISLHKEGKWPGAEKIYRTILKMQPENHAANHNLGVLIVQCGCPVLAIPYLENALRSNPETDQYWVSYIEILIEICQIDAAGRMLIQARQRGVVVDVFYQRIQDLLSTSSFDYTYALKYWNQGRFSEAAAWLRIWLVDHPEDAEAYACLAQVQGDLRLYDDAEHSIYSALHLAPDNLVVLRSYSHFLLRKQQNVEAIRMAKFAYRRDPSNFESQLTLATALTSGQGNCDQIKSLVESVIQTQPRCAEAFALRALLKKRYGDISGALEDAETALSIKPHLTHLWMMVGNLRCSCGNLAGAIEALKVALSKEPDSPSVLAVLGEYKRLAGEIDESLRLLGRATTLAPKNAEAWCIYGVALQEAGLTAAAKSAYFRALELDADQVETANNIGVLLKNEGRLLEAEKHFRRALEIRPNFADGQSNLGAVLLAQGCFVEAEVCFRAALDICADHFEALLGIGALLQFQARTEEQKIWMSHGLIAPKYSWKFACLLMITAWIQGQIDEVSRFAEQYRFSIPIGISDGVTRSLRIFFGYVSKLAEFANNNPHLYAIRVNAGPDFHVLGESHSLALASLTMEWNSEKVRPVAHFVNGVKMFHLASCENNQYKKAISIQLKELPEKSHVLFTIGEIDCRPNEGIWHYVCMTKSLVDDVINHTVSGYLNWLDRELSHNAPATVTIQGVPAPNYLPDEELAKNETEGFLAMIASVNQHLKAGALMRGWKFIDVYKATAVERGVSNGKWHIDKYHLKPSFYADLSEWLCG